MPDENIQRGNSIVLIRENDSGGPRHGGWRVYRHYSLYINGKHFRRYVEDSAGCGWAFGSYFDEYIESELRQLSDILGCTPVRGRVKGFDTKAGLPSRLDNGKRAAR